MKTVLVKKATPFAVVALAVAGAFATTSMQSASVVEDEIGYTLNSQGACNIEVACSTIQAQVCRVNGNSGARFLVKTIRKTVPKFCFVLNFSNPFFSKL
ncbi:DUF6520 family protein [Flavobacterium salmonis]|uniref:Uncharacterized protein n=1 Tax=Flavobacterium salmonis TaxID=2654844 RepID=A0A6V6YNX9_9FLAO|nr:DUF6520 family protein [Flavobacterium salmonis]CAD0001079.1 hypothetical protein FLAT13_00375 [Flavobacterium salmonis]